MVAAKEAAAIRVGERVEEATAAAGMEVAVMVVVGTKAVAKDKGMMEAAGAVESMVVVLLVVVVMVAGLSAVMREVVARVVVARVVVRVVAMTAVGMAAAAMAVATEVVATEAVMVVSTVRLLHTAGR